MIATVLVLVFVVGLVAGALLAPAVARLSARPQLSRRVQDRLEDMEREYQLRVVTDELQHHGQRKPPRDAA